MGAGARWALYTPHPRSPSPSSSGSSSSSSVGCSRTYPKIKSDSSRKSTCPKLPTGNKSPEPNIFFLKFFLKFFLCVWRLLGKQNKQNGFQRPEDNAVKSWRTQIYELVPGVRKSLGGIVSLSSSRMWVSKALLQLAVRRREVPGSSSFFKNINGMTTTRGGRPIRLLRA